MLAVADDEHRRRHRSVVHEPEPLTPRLDQQRDQLPLRTAGVLELVDQHMVIARLEPVAALRKLIHPPQQVQGALKHVGKIEHRPGSELALVLRDRDRKHPLRTAREHHVQVAVERRQRLGHRRRELPPRLAVVPTGLRRPALPGAIGCEPLTRPTVAGEEVLPDPVQHRPHRRRLRVPQRGKTGQLASQHLEPGVLKGSVGQETGLAPVDPAHHVRQPCCRPSTGHARRRPTWAGRQKALQRRRRDKPPLEQMRQTGPHGSAPPPCAVPG